MMRPRPQISTAGLPEHQSFGVGTPLGLAGIAEPPRPLLSSLVRGPLARLEPPVALPVTSPGESLPSAVRVELVEIFDQIGPGRFFARDEAVVILISS
jgi:hypothetical protein